MADIILNDEDILLPFTEETPVHESFMNPIINCVNKNTTRSKENSLAIGQKAEKTQLSNPNLLMNAYFPIWQRGTSFGSGVYSADRWIGFSANGNVQVTKDTDSSLKISATQAEFAGITQPIEGKYRDLVGKKVTLSAKVKSTIPILLSVETGGTTVDSAVFPTSAEYTIISKTLTLPASINENTLRVLVVGNQQIGTINVAWVKFELGDIATPFSPRPYAEELVMCQRYYQRIDIFGEVCWSAFYLYTGYFYFSPIMRVSPTLTFSALKDGALGKISVYNLDSNFNKNATISSQLLTSSKFRLYGNGEFIPDTTYVGGAVIADAEIY